MAPKNHWPCRTSRCGAVVIAALVDRLMNTGILSLNPNFESCAMARPKQEKRGVARLASRLSLTVKLKDGARASAETRDISSRGLFFFTDAKIEKASEIEIIMMMPPELAPFDRRWVCCHATVVRVENDPQRRQIGVAAVINRLDTLPEI